MGTMLMMLMVPTIALLGIIAVGLLTFCMFRKCKDKSSRCCI